LADLVPNHVVAVDDPRIPDDVRGRAMLVRRLDMLPVECVARGYLTGSGLLDYRATGAVCGIALPVGLVEASRLPEPIFTPATKAAIGEHDENVTFDAVVDTVGAERAEQLRALTLALYSRATDHAATRGLLLADTKVEFGLQGNAMVLGDEVLTPDSSRFWPADGYAAGHPQPSFDKQYVRDWLTSAASGWDRTSDAPPPALPDDVVAATRGRYIDAYERISGRSFDDWIG
jgi:phosphoribosylaminoimidazole-succinocarboxamide synthase